MPVEVAFIKEEPYSYPSRTYANNGDSSVIAVHYKPIPDRLEQMARNDTVKKKDEQNLKKDWRGDAQLSTQFRKHQPAFLKVIEELESIPYGPLGRINLYMQRIDLQNDKVMSLHSAPYRARPTTRQLTAAKINQILPENIIEPANIESAAPIVLAPKKGGSLRFCVDYRK